MKEKIKLEETKPNISEEETINIPDKSEELVNTPDYKGDSFGNIPYDEYLKKKVEEKEEVMNNND